MTPNFSSGRGRNPCFARFQHRLSSATFRGNLLASGAEVQRMLLELRQLSVPPGQRVLLHDVSWQELETILQELGEHRAARIAYDNGTLEIMTPLPEHEDNKEIIGDLVKALLEELDI